MQFSVIVYLFSVTSARANLKSKRKLNRSLFAAIVTTIILALSFSLLVHDACSNSKGYCKDGSMGFTFRGPNNSLKPAPTSWQRPRAYATLARVRRPAAGRLNSGVRRADDYYHLQINS